VSVLFFLQPSQILGLPDVVNRFCVTEGAMKARERKTRDQKTQHQYARVENARLKHTLPYCWGGKRRTGKRGTALQEVENARLENAGSPKYGKLNVT